MIGQTSKFNIENIRGFLTGKGDRMTIDEVDTALIREFSEEPSPQGTELLINILNAGVASGRLVHSSQLSEMTEEERQEAIVVVNGAVPHDITKLYEPVMGVLYTSPDTAYETTHFSIAMKTYGICMGFIKGDLTRDSKGRITQISLIDKSDKEETINIGDYVTLDAVNGRLFKGHTPLTSSGTYRTVQGHTLKRGDKKEHKRFYKSLDGILKDVKEESGISLSVNLFSPEQLERSYLIARTSINLVRTEAHLVNPEDRVNFQLLFAIMYGKSILDNPDSPIGSRLPRRQKTKLHRMLEPCIRSLLDEFRTRQEAHSYALLSEFYKRVKKKSSGILPFIQQRFLDASLNEIFCNNAREVRDILLDHGEEDRLGYLMDREIAKSIRDNMRIHRKFTEEALQYFVGSPDYSTGLRGVKLSQRFPMIYEAQAQAFISSIKRVSGEQKMFYRYVDPTLMIPYVSQPGEVERVREITDRANQGIGAKFDLGVLLELQSSATYMEQFLELGIRRFMIGTNDLIAGWYGQDRLEGIRFDDEGAREGIMSNFRLFLANINRGISSYKRKNECEDLSDLRMTLSGELPARMYVKLLESFGKRIITGIGLTPKKIPHVACELHRHYRS